MNPLSRLFASLGHLGAALRGQIHEQRKRRDLGTRYPGVHFEWPIHFLVDDFDALTIHPGAHIGPFSEVVVLRSAPQSTVAGALVIGAGTRLGMGANLRAAGGTITLGARTQIGQHVSIIASNHLLDPVTGRPQPDRWATGKTGVTIGDECWIGAGAVLLPGVNIGHGATVGAGSVVTKSVGAGQVWLGNPARAAGTRIE